MANEATVERESVGLKKKFAIISLWSDGFNPDYERINWYTSRGEARNAFREGQGFSRTQAEVNRFLMQIIDVAGNDDIGRGTAARADTPASASRSISGRVLKSKAAGQQRGRHVRTRQA
jgi:hypothetical protein